MSGKLKEYLGDPFLSRLYSDIRKAGSVKSIQLDITHECNLRCQGCYFFTEEMDRYKSPQDEAEFDSFIEREKARGTNYITVTGGEPTLVLQRLKKLYNNFWMSVVTNGIKRIPYEGFEKMPIGVSVWGDHERDKQLRGNGKIDVFAKALKNYKDDPRVKWYYTTTAGNAHEIENVVRQCVANGNFVVFDFYGDLKNAGKDLDHRQGFSHVFDEMKRMIELFPDRIMCTEYMLEVVATGTLFGEKWGYDVCGSITFDHEKNKERIGNGKPYNSHFRSYCPDLKSTRRCCVGEDRDCSTCYDLWAHFSWIISNMRRHMESKKDFTNWLTTVYMFYFLNQIVSVEEGVKLMPEIHKRISGKN